MSSPVLFPALSRFSSPIALVLCVLAAGITTACGDAPGSESDFGHTEQEETSMLTPVSRTESFGEAGEPHPATEEATESLGSQAQALKSNGCSNPQFTEAIQQMLHPLPASLKSLFKPACDTHDYCYSSGKAFYGFSRASCDNTFGSDLMAICSRTYFDPILLSACQLSATEFTVAVKVAGASHYLNTPCLVGQTNASDCSTHEPYLNNAPISKDYILYTTTNGRTYRVTGSPSSGSTLLPGTATALSAYAFRGGYIANNTLNLIEGDPSSAQTVFTSPAASFKVSGNRVGAIFINAGFFLQEGALLSSWTSGIFAHLFDLDRDRVVVATRGAKYSVWLKKGPTSAAWKEIWSTPSEEIQQLSVSGSRIAMTRSYKLSTTDDDGVTWVDSPFHWVDSTQTKMAGRRLGTVVGVGQNTSWDLMLTQDAPKNKNYTRIASDVSAWDTTATRLAVVTGGQLWLQDGSLSGVWRNVGTAQSVKLSGNRVAFVDGGKLYVKDGTVADSWTTRANWTLVASGVSNYSIWQKGDYDPSDYVNVIQ